MRRRAVAAIALALLASGCGATPTNDASSTPKPTAAGSSSAGASTDTSEPVQWQRLDVPNGATVLTGDDESLRLDASRAVATVGGATVKAGAGRVFESADLDDGTALLVSRPKSGEGDQRGLLVDAESSKTRTLAGQGVIAPATVGAWSLGDDHVAYTSQQGSAVFCLTVADVESLKGHVVRCGKAREGLTQLRVSDDRIGFTTFVNAQPMACLTLWTAGLGSGDPQPVDQATKCRGWEAAPIDGSVAWTEIVRPGQVELGRVRGLDGDEVVELGRGSTGTLTGCDDWVWWSQPPGDGHGDRLMRWRPGSKPEVAHDTGSSDAPVTSLSCSDDRLSFVVLEGGSETTYVEKG